jgi:hypothetical protein
MPKKNKIFLAAIILLFTAMVIVQHFVPRLENAGILTMYSQYKVTTGSQIKLTTPF